ncbi:MAG: hypothetical protein KA764_08660 [Anaerolineales bacterium]|nr:hypothetical protein [Anaerolineales bacterium]
MRIIDVVPSGLTEFLRGGREKAGEDLVLAHFGKVLDDQHVMLRHLTLPEATDKLGLVLVGPEGIWHLEQLTLASLVNNAGVWMHWDYTKQSVQPVPFSTIASQARSRLAEIQAHLGPAGFGARQALIVTTPNAPRDFAIPGLDIVLFVDEIAEFVRDVMPQHAPAAPLAVPEAVNVLTGRTKPPAPSAAAPRPAGGPAWLSRRYPRLGALTGQQLLVLGLAVLGNCCLFSTFIYLIATTP